MLTPDPDKFIFLLTIFLLVAGCALKPGMVRNGGEVYCTTIASCTLSMKEKIESRWIRPKSTKGKKLQAVIDIAINSDKSVGDVTIVKSSRSTDFDESAVSAIEESSPFRVLNGINNTETEKIFKEIRLVFEPNKHNEEG